MSDELRDKAERMISAYESMQTILGDVAQEGSILADSVLVARAYLALRRSHAEAVEAAVREIEAMDANFFNRLSVIKAIRKHLGPAAAVEKGE